MQLSQFLLPSIFAATVLANSEKARPVQFHVMTEDAYLPLYLDVVSTSFDGEPVYEMFYQSRPTPATKFLLQDEKASINTDSVQGFLGEMKGGLTITSKSDATMWDLDYDEKVIGGPFYFCDRVEEENKTYVKYGESYSKMKGCSEVDLHIFPYQKPSFTN